MNLWLIYFEKAILNLFFLGLESLKDFFPLPEWLQQVQGGLHFYQKWVDSYLDLEKNQKA